MKDENLEYLERNFLTAESVAAETEITVEELNRLIEEGRVPGASYAVKNELKITSPLGDAYDVCSETRYFPKPFPVLVSRVLAGDFDTESLFAELENNLDRHPDKSFAYENAEGDSEKTKAALDAEIAAFLKGIYGICTLNQTPEEIIEKEIAVKKLIAWKDNGEAGDDDLIARVGAYDRVSALFAPYQRETSSRGKYVDSSLKKIGRDDLIKKY
ncbi:MAG: DUF6058 family natural product biosynthesis protein [Pyrinomonadaceae bacterium]